MGSPIGSGVSLHEWSVSNTARVSTSPGRAMSATLRNADANRHSVPGSVPGFVPASTSAARVNRLESREAEHNETDTPLDATLPDRFTRQFPAMRTGVPGETAPLGIPSPLSSPLSSRFRPCFRPARRRDREVRRDGAFGSPLCGACAR